LQRNKKIQTNHFLKENSIFAGVKQTNMEYTILIHKDVEGGWYCGQCQQLPGAISQGKTLDELMENMKDAIQLVLEYNKEQALQAFKGERFFYRKLALA
jgi:predicted RNase H-like HicB family nuclease